MVDSHEDRNDNFNFLLSLMSLSTGCILSPRQESNGTRISVMSRHTLDDGVTPDERIIAWIHFDEWAPKLAPPPKIVWAFYRGGLNWQEYIEAYNGYLKTTDIQELVRQLIERALKQDITILCIEDTPEYCHRRLLAEKCQRIEEKLVILLK